MKMKTNHAEMPLALMGSFRSAGACPPPQARDKPWHYGHAPDDVGVVDQGRLGSLRDIAARHSPLSLQAPFLLVIARSVATKQPLSGPNKARLKSEMR
ncbi:MAG TPA: hypothetical protein VMW37_05325 [Dehalococcoidales bacterium]|nr:hypothetical protein [Dehalococcoidales bacterium]